VLRQVDDELWGIDHRALPGAWFPFGTRTTLVRLSDGGVFMHSPGPLSIALAKQIDAIGPVRCIVAPNAFHHLFVAENARAWQGASVHLAPGLAAKRKDLSFSAELGDVASPEWSADLDQCLVAGASRVNEVAFLHRASRTLILTDLVFNVSHGPTRAARLFLRLMGLDGRPASTRLMRWLTRDREAARESVLRILAWDFERVVLAHGEIVERGGRDVLRESLAWLIDRRTARET